MVIVHSRTSGYSIRNPPTLLAKAGCLPVWLSSHINFNTFWTALMTDVSTNTADTNALSHMLQLQQDVATFMAATVHNPWLVAAHRILSRLDLACHHADLKYLSEPDRNEEAIATLRASSVPGQPTQSSSSANRSASFGAPAYNRKRLAERQWGRSRQQQQPTNYCEHHRRNCFHTSQECSLNPANAGGGAANRQSANRQSQAQSGRS